MIMKGLLPWYFSLNAPTKAQPCDHVYADCRTLMLILPQCDCPLFPHLNVSFPRLRMI